MNRPFDPDIVLLEERYQTRGLKFTVPFTGLEPVQAYGHVDNMRFYYRFRGTTASLKVGTYDKGKEEQRAKENNERLKEVCFNAPDFPAPQETDADLYPTNIILESSTQNTHQPLVGIFIELMETLQHHEI